MLTIMAVNIDILFKIKIQDLFYHILNNILNYILNNYVLDGFLLKLNYQ